MSTVADWLQTKKLPALANYGEAPIERSQTLLPKRNSARVTNTLTGVSFNTLKLLEAFRSNAPGGWSDNRMEQARHFVSTAYICIRTLCEQAAGATVKIFQRDDSHPEGKRQCHYYEDPMKLMFDPNPEDTLGELLYQTMLQMELTGSSLLWKVPDWFGKPRELYNVPTATATPLPPTQPMYPYGAYRVQPFYPFGPFSTYPSMLTAVGAVIPGEHICRVKNPHPILRYDGYATSTAIRYEEDSLEAINRSRLQGMLRGVDPTAMVTFDPEVENPTPEEIIRIREEFAQMFAGPENAGRALILMPGTKVAPYSLSPKEMGWPDSFAQLTAFVSAAYGVTKPVAGMNEEASYAQLYAAIKQFHVLSLCPRLNRIGGGWSKRLIMPGYGPDYWMEIHPQKIDDEDILKAKLDALARGGSITNNELRVAFGFPLTKEEWGEWRVGKDPQEAAPAMNLGGVPGAEQPAAPAPEGSVPLSAEVEAERPVTGETGSFGAREFPKTAAPGGQNSAPREAGRPDLRMLAREFHRSRSIPHEKLAEWMSDFDKMGTWQKKMILASMPERNGHVSANGSH
jgi:phage portal protein BeeE